MTDRLPERVCISTNIFYSITTIWFVSAFSRALGCLYLLMNFVTNDLFIAENFDVVRYSVFKERSPLIADIKPFQSPELVLYSVQFRLF